MKKSRKMLVASWLFVIVLVIASAGVWQRDQLTAWYRAWKLQQATPDMHATFVRQFEALGLTGTGALVGMFSAKDETTCQNAGLVLIKILQVWAPPDSRRESALQQLASAAHQFSPAGQLQCLKIIQQLLSEVEPSPAIVQLIGKLTTQLGSEAETRLALYDTLVKVLGNDQNNSDALLQQARACVLSGIKDESIPIRLAAIRLGVSPALQLHQYFVPMVTDSVIDPSPEVRQLVLLALGEHEKLLATEELCKFLHDANDEVRNIAEKALSVRGFNQNQLKLARMMNDPSPATRAELPAMVFATPEVDSFMWLERLSRDPTPAVRAASARAMGENGDDRLNSLMQQLAEHDKDPMVRHLARFYWKQ